MRYLRLRLNSPRRASVLTLYVDSWALVLGAAVGGKPVGDSLTHTSAARGKYWSLRYYALPSEGVELSLQLKASEPLRLRLVDQSYGLPELHGATFNARPAGIAPAPVPLTDSTYVSKAFAL